jgi:hypothetical protein
LVATAEPQTAVIVRALKEARGIRFSDKIADELGQNLRSLENGGWSPTLIQCNRLTQLAPRETELQVAAYVRESFVGFGPKQSRNLLQALGLTRYEIPIDSRVTSWLNASGFPVRLSAIALADTNYYRFVSDGIQALCDACDVFPCVFDAAIFASKDTGEFATEELIF